MRQATAPGYTGEIGKAAIEGYNLVIDKYNYDQAVKADYEEELEDQMGSLNVEADFLTDQARQDYLELSMSKKKEARMVTSGISITPTNSITPNGKSTIKK